MNDREYALAKELAALWPECIDPRQQSGMWVASDRLQDYLAAARKRWPELTLDIRRNTASLMGATIHPLEIWFGRGETDCERILAALLQAAKGEA